MVICPEGQRARLQRQKSAGTPAHCPDLFGWIHFLSVFHLPSLAGTVWLAPLHVPSPP